MNLEAWTQSGAWLRAGWTFVHFLWIGALIAAAAMLSRVLLWRADARIRYTLALGWMIVLAAAPIVIAMRLSVTSVDQAITNRTPAAPPVARTDVTFPVAQRHAMTSGTFAIPEAPRQGDGAAPVKIANAKPGWKSLIPILPWAWIIGSGLALGWSLLGVVGAERLRRRRSCDAPVELMHTCARLARSIGLSRRVGVRICQRAISPILIGIVRPMILLPAALINELPPEQLEMILLHELAHVRRWDNAINLVQRIVESLLFFQPAVWMVSHWARVEREHCCDDAVLRRRDDPGAYVDALLSARKGMRRQWIAAQTAATGGNFARRLRRILGSREQMRIGSETALAILAIALAGVLCIGITVRAAKGAGKATQPTVLIVSKKAGAKYSSIQSAIDAAPDGATVRIEPGEYVESLSIKKPLTLEGAGWQQTTIVIPNDKSADIAQAVADAQKQIAAGKSRREVQKALAELEQKFSVPGVAISGAKNVTLRKLKITSNPTGFAGSKERFADASLVRIENAGATVDDCALLGSPGAGIVIEGGADATIERSLIAAVWGTGIAVRGHRDLPPKVHIVDCDVRNCYYAGVVTARSDTTIEHCRISGAAWHGIRYEDSPIVRNNIIWGNRRCGIYADPNEKGATVEGNLFYRNEWSGIWCLRRNIDRVIGNTFAFNGREAFMASGGAKPVVERNVFYANATAISVGTISGNDPEDKLVGAPQLKANIFWANDLTMVEPAPDGAQPATRATKPAADTGSIYKNPEYKNPEKGDFSTPADSPARKAHAGVDESKFPAFASPWPITPEEKAIIPDGPSRNYQLWKAPTK